MAPATLTDLHGFPLSCWVNMVALARLGYIRFLPIFS